MNALSKTLLAAYLFMLLWLVLFKFSYDPLSVLLDYQTRSLNLIPFAQGNKSEMISNLVAFVPLGVMVGVNFKKIPFLKKLGAIVALSAAVEVIQYVLAIGAADITDTLLNTFGGLVGLAFYDVAREPFGAKYLDWGVFVLGTSIIVTVLYLRIFVFRVRY